MDDLDGVLEAFHRTVQSGFSYWRRVAVAAPGMGLPLGMVVAVYVDAFVDGFLIGLASSLSHHAGLVLAVANVIEMCFVGAAFSATVALCTGASRGRRVTAVSLTSAVLVAAAAIGAALGGWSRANPGVYTGFVAFGVVALLFLVTQELLIEAYEAVKDLGRKWINTVFFIGIYLVLLSNRIIPN